MFNNNYYLAARLPHRPPSEQVDSSCGSDAGSLVIASMVMIHLNSSSDLTPATPTLERARSRSERERTRERACGARVLEGSIAFSVVSRHKLVGSSRQL